MLLVGSVLVLLCRVVAGRSREDTNSLGSQLCFSLGVVLVKSPH